MPHCSYIARLVGHAVSISISVTVIISVLFLMSYVLATNLSMRSRVMHIGPNVLRWFLNQSPLNFYFCVPQTITICIPDRESSPVVTRSWALLRAILRRGL